MTSQIHYDTHLEEVINHAKFDVGTPGSIAVVKTNTQTELCFDKNLM